MREQEQQEAMTSKQQKQADINLIKKVNGDGDHRSNVVDNLNGSLDKLEASGVMNGKSINGTDSLVLKSVHENGKLEDGQSGTN